MCSKSIQPRQTLVGTPTTEQQVPSNVERRFREHHMHPFLLIDELADVEVGHNTA